MAQNWEFASGLFLFGLGIIFVIGFLIGEIGREILNVSFILLIIGLAAMSVGVYRQLSVTG